MKRSGLTKELVEVREALSCATLQRDVLQTEKAEVAEALAKVSPVSHTTHGPSYRLDQPCVRLWTGHAIDPFSG